MYSYHVPRIQSFDLGDGFTARVSDLEVIKKYDLVGQGALHYVNTLSTLVDEKKEELPEKDWNVLAFSLKRLMIDYERGELYYYLLQTHGEESLNFNVWVHFSDDAVWHMCVRTFTDMPTPILEEYCIRHWADRSKTIGKEGMQHILNALHAREDVYGENGGLPPEMIRGLLFNEELV